MAIKYSNTLPKKIEQIGTNYILCINVNETTEEEILSLWQNYKLDIGSISETPYDYFVEEHKYNYNQISVPVGKWTYSDVIEAIIRDKYSADEMEAIINNKMKSFFQNPETEDQEYNQMQEWRILAKQEAKNIFKNGYSI